MRSLALMVLGVLLCWLAAGCAAADLAGSGSPPGVDRTTH